MGARTVVEYLDELADVDLDAADVSGPTVGLVEDPSAPGTWRRGTLPTGGSGSSAGLLPRVRAGWPAQTISTAVGTPNLQISSPSADTAGFWDAGSPSVLTAPYAGVYLIGASAGISDTSAFRFLRIFVNGAVINQARAARPAGSGFHDSMMVTVWAELEAGDEVSFGIFHNHGSNRNLYRDGNGCWMVGFGIDSVDGGTFADAGTGTVDGGTL